MSFLEWLSSLFGRRPEVRLAFNLHLPGNFNLKECIMRQVTMTTAQQFEFTVIPKVGNQNATIDGPLAVSANSELVVGVEPVEGIPYRYRVIAYQPGTDQILISGDADLDEGETRTVQETIQVTVLVAEADRLELDIADPTDKPAPADSVADTNET